MTTREEEVAMLPAEGNQEETVSTLVVGTQRRWLAAATVFAVCLVALAGSQLPSSLTSAVASTHRNGENSVLFLSVQKDEKDEIVQDEKDDKDVKGSSLTDVQDGIAASGGWRFDECCDCCQHQKDGANDCWWDGTPDACGKSLTQCKKADPVYYGEGCPAKAVAEDEDVSNTASDASAAATSDTDDQDKSTDESDGSSSATLGGQTVDFANIKTPGDAQKQLEVLEKAAAKAGGLQAAIADSLFKDKPLSPEMVAQQTKEMTAKNDEQTQANVKTLLSQNAASSQCVKEGTDCFRRCVNDASSPSVQMHCRRRTRCRRNNSPHAFPTTNCQNECIAQQTDCIFKLNA